MKILVLFYSAHGHTYKMAEAEAEGARLVEGVEVVIKKVPETLPEAILKKTGVLEDQKVFAHIPEATVAELVEYDAIIFGAPTRFGMMASQMKAFLDGTGRFWVKGSLVGKLTGVFTSTETPHGGQEATILSFHTLLLHHGMVIAGLPYTFPGLWKVDEVTGGSPYGASTIALPELAKSPTNNELDGARFQGEYIAKLTKKMTCCPPEN